MKAILAALMLCCCTATKEPFPTDTENQRQWKQEYREGKLSWSEYQEKLKTEKP